MNMTDHLASNVFFCFIIHQERVKVIDLFRSGDVKVVIATDLASRGLDTTQVIYFFHKKPRLLRIANMQETRSNQLIQ